MIRKVKFSNFYSFYKEQEIDFLATKKKTYDYYSSKSGQQITKIAGFIGGNASGKTNIMRLFSFISYFVCRKIDEEEALIKDIAYKTFFNNKEKSDFYIEFEKDNFIFYYDFSVKMNFVLSESLSIKEIKKGSRKTQVFTCQGGKIKMLNKNFFINLPIKALPKIREDISFITFIKQSAYRVDIVDSIYNYFLNLKTNINEVGKLNTLAQQIKTLNMHDKDKALKKEMEEFVSYFDIGLTGFEIEKKNIDKGIFIEVRGIHSSKLKNNKLDFIYESRGTQSLFFMMANLLSALKNNSVVIIDEMETGLHPEALNKIIGYFIDENKDKTAQLIFSSHSLGFMNKLDMHQIYLTEKNELSESSLIRLNKVEGIRPDENLLAKYMSGVYGGFPEIRV